MKSADENCELDVRASRKAAMAFLRHVVVMCVPLVVVAGLAIWAGQVSGETLSISAVLERQQLDASGEGPLFQRKYASQGSSEFALKNLALEELAPKIVIAGSSRALSFRTELLNQPSTPAYNYGFAMRSLDDLMWFSEAVVKQGDVEAVLLTVDRWWFRADEEAGSVAAAMAGAKNPLTDDFRIHVSLLRDVARGTVRPSEILNPKNRALGFECIGIGAVEIGGYRPDGSYCYANVVAARRAGDAYRDMNWRPHAVAARQHTSHFGPPYVVSEGHRNKFFRGVKKLVDAGVSVAVINPPYSTELWGVLNDDPEHRRMTDAETEVVASVCGALGVPLVDARSLATLGMDDRYMVDGYHCTETACAVILRELWRREECPEKLRGCGLAAIDAILGASEAWELDADMLRGLGKAVGR